MVNYLHRWKYYFFAAIIGALLTVFAASVGIARADADAPSSSAKSSDEHQAKLEAALSKMLSGATLEGSFTMSGAGSDPTKLSREKYTLGEVKKIGDDTWLFPTRIEYGGKDITLPIPLPIRWAGDTPVVVVDQVDLPGLGTMSARVMFFEGHYAGFWKHGEHSGNLFGEIHSVKEKADATPAAATHDAAPPAGKR